MEKVKISFFSVAETGSHSIQNHSSKKIQSLLWAVIFYTCYRKISWCFTNYLNCVNKSKQLQLHCVNNEIKQQKTHMLIFPKSTEFETASAILIYTYLYAGKGAFAIAELSGGLFSDPAVWRLLSRTRRASKEVNASQHRRPFLPGDPERSALQNCPHKSLCAPTHAESLQRHTFVLQVQYVFSRLNSASTRNCCKLKQTKLFP